MKNPILRVVDLVERLLLDAFVPVPDVDDEPQLHLERDGEFFAWTIATPGTVLAAGTGVDYDDALAKGWRIYAELGLAAA